jgi:hypothetical protein
MTPEEAKIEWKKLLYKSREISHRQVRLKIELEETIEQAESICKLEREAYRKYKELNEYGNNS